MKATFSPPPLFRGLALLLVLYGAFRTQDAWALVAALVVAVGTLWLQGKFRSFAMFAVSLVLPVGFGLALIWGFIRQEAPGPLPTVSIRAGLLFALTTTLRLALLGALFQMAVLSLPAEQLVHLLQSFGMRGRWLAIIVSTLNLWPDFRRHAENVFAARCARGLMPDRRLLTRARQLPFAIRTLFISSLGHAIERAESWESSGLVDRLGQFSQEVSTARAYSWTAGYAWLAASMTWAALATFHLP